jgi:hypothetical protein
METREITIRPVRLTTQEYADLKRAAELERLSVGEYVAALIREALDKK